jgi:hypothetical protein
MVSYAYRYARLGAMERATDLAQRAENKILDDLKYQMSQYDGYRSEISSLQQRIQQAQRNANYSTQQKLQNKLENIKSARKNQAQQVSYASSRLIYVQRIYYMADKNEEAKSLAREVNEISMDRLGFPTTEKENKNQVDRMPMGI